MEKDFDLVLYRQSTGKWKIYRNSGFFGARWRQVFETNDEGEAERRYQLIFDRMRQGGVRLLDDTAGLAKQFFISWFPLRVGEHFGKNRNLPSYHLCRIRYPIGTRIRRIHRLSAGNGKALSHRFRSLREWIWYPTCLM